MKHEIFISHASRDEALAQELVDVLLNNGCDVISSRILCTSIEGMKIPAGTDNFIDFLKSKIQSPKLVILLLTENYFDSEFCLCELGATWAMSLEYFPICVSPITKSSMQATLQVSQAGDILDKFYLDELRDKVKDALGSEVKTGRWSLKRDEFLKAAPKIIDSLTKPQKIDKALLDEADEKYEAALEELSNQGTLISELESQIKELEACKDSKQVKAVKRKYTDDYSEFEGLCESAKIALNNLKYATKRCSFWHNRETFYWKPDRDDSDNAEEAEAVNELSHDDDLGYSLNTDHPRVMEAIDKLSELQSFLDEKEMQDGDSIVDTLGEEHKIPISLSNKDFWHKFLVYV